jgi:hypothetical protein
MWPDHIGVFLIGFNVKLEAAGYAEPLVFTCRLHGALIRPRPEYLSGLVKVKTVCRAV